MGNTSRPSSHLGAGLPTAPTHLLPFDQHGYLTDTLATKRKLVPRALPARYLLAPSQHQYQAGLPTDMVRLERVCDFIKVIDNGSASTTANRYPRDAGVKHPGGAQFWSAGRGCYKISRRTASPRWHAWPAPALSTGPATNAAALLLAPAAATPSATADSLSAPRSIKEARGRPAEWHRVHDAELRTHDTVLQNWTYEYPLPTDKPLPFTFGYKAKAIVYGGLERRKAPYEIHRYRMRPSVNFDEMRTASHMPPQSG
jgi:hypothetical protein